MPTLAIQSTASTTKEVSLNLGGVTWQLRKPAGYETLAVADNQGVLWVKFPPVGESAGWGGRPRPDGNYAIMYTPLRAHGGNLEDTARALLQIEGNVGDTDRYILDLASAAAGHFLVKTYTINPNAQTGGVAEYWWLEPVSEKSVKLLSVTQGGGHLFTVAQNDSWLFWSSANTNETGSPINGQSYLVNLITAQAKLLHLGDLNWVPDALWKADGRLYYHLPNDNSEHILDASNVSSVLR